MVILFWLKKYCKDIYDYDTSNIKILNLYLAAELESLTAPLENINKLYEMTIIENMLLMETTDYGSQEILNRLINACIVYLSKKYCVR